LIEGEVALKIKKEKSVEIETKAERQKSFEQEIPSCFFLRRKMRSPALGASGNIVRCDGGGKEKTPKLSKSSSKRERFHSLFF